MIKNAIRIGWQAGKKNFLPGMAVGFLILTLMVGYHHHSGVHNVLAAVGKWKQEWGIIFSFVVLGFFGGVVAELFRVVFFQKGRVSFENLENALFRFFVMGGAGVSVDFFYQGQDFLLGKGQEVWRVGGKVLVDQFLFSPIWMGPYQALAFEWKNRGYRVKGMGSCFSVDFYGHKVLPVVVTTLFFWIPTCSGVYSMPLELQIPVLASVQVVWGCILTSVTDKKGS